MDQEQSTIFRKPGQRPEWWTVGSDANVAGQAVWYLLANAMVLQWAVFMSSIEFGVGKCALL